MKNAVIIGGTGGIGGSLAKSLVANDYDVYSVSRSSPNPCDLTNNDDIKKSIELIKNKFKSIDLLINAAGVATYKNISDVSNSDLEEAFKVNVIAPAIFIRGLAPLMTHEDAVVLNIGSGCGVIPMKGRSIYCATKFALRGLSLSLSEEFQSSNPRFCHITLGSTLTEFGPMTIQEKMQEQQKGKAYFPLDWLTSKLMEIINDNNRQPEITLFPQDFGFGVQNKPQHAT